MAVYYNDIDPVACDVLEGLIKDGVIADGVVDRRSIKEVDPRDLIGFKQWHLFAGVGAWSVAARIAGWPDSRTLLSASCPCQPFSVAGKGAGINDPRHLWPDLFRLICALRPDRIVGEQVGQKAGYGWLDGVRADLEPEDYTCEAVDIPACSVNAPHQRNRIYWVALADSNRGGCDGRQGDEVWEAQQRNAAQRAPEGHLEHTPCFGRGEGRAEYELWGRRSAATSTDVLNVWGDAEWITCADGKARRAKSGLPFLVDGLDGRIDSWRLAGNSIVIPLAQKVIEALMEVE